MAKFVYMDESGAARGKLQEQPYFLLVAAIIDENEIQPLAKGMRAVASDHLEWLPSKLEFHGVEVWNGKGPWAGKTPPELLAVYRDTLALLDTHDIDLALATINRPGLDAKYGGAFNDSAYLLALQFLLEKVDTYLPRDNKVLIADEHKAHQLAAVDMVADLQNWNVGAVPGRQLRTIIDSLHFVDSQISPGVQMADMVAFIRGRRRNVGHENHPDAEAAMEEFLEMIASHIRTYRMEWPP